MRKECTNCHNYRIENGKRLTHKCKEYPQFTVYGLLTGTVNPECMKFSAIHTTATDRKSIKEATLIRAGGTWKQQQEATKQYAKQHHKWLCESCGKEMYVYRSFCEDCELDFMKRNNAFLAKKRQERKTAK